MKRLLLTAFLLLAPLAGCAGAAAPPVAQEPPMAPSPTSPPSEATPAVEGPRRPVQELFARTLESIGADGRDRRLLLRDFRGSRPVFSPDGAVVAYDELTQDGVSLHLWDVKSGQDTVALRGYNVYKLLWSTDGRWLAAAHEPSSSIETQAVVLGRDGVVRASTPGRPVSWRPGHPQLLVFRGTALLLLDAETGEAHQLVEVRQALDRTPGAWSPDGRQLVYPAPAEGSCPSGPSPVALRVLDMETGQGRQVWGPTCTLVLDMAWSREGDRLAVAVTEWADQPQRGIHMLDLGTGQTTFVPSVGGVDSRLSWLAGGHLLSLRPVCYACDPGYWGLWLFDAQGRAVASWGLSADDRSYAVAADGSRVAIGTDAGELLVMAVGSDGPRRLLDERPFQAFGLSWAGPHRIAFVRGALWNTVSVLVTADGSGGKAVPLPANARRTTVSLASGRATYVVIGPLYWATYMAALDGSSARPLPQGWVLPLAWSPDGRRLVGHMAQEGSPEVLAVLDGNGRTVAIGPPAPGVYPHLLSWSPDGRRLAWSAQERLWLWDLDSGQVRELGTAYPRPGQSPPPGFVAWSPDGRYLAYDGPEGLTLHELATGQKRLLVPGHPLAVAWSPNGRELAYLGHDPFGRGMGLHVVSLEGGQGRALVPSVGPPHGLFGEIVLRWSPRGDRLAYVSASPTLAYGAEVMVVDVATGRQESITGPLHCHASLLDWSNDGRWLAVAVDGLCL